MTRSIVPAMLLLGAGVAGIILSPPSAQGAERPIRWNTGGAVWSTHQQPISRFLATGEITDRGCSMASIYPVGRPMKFELA